MPNKKSEKLPRELAWLARAHVELAKATTVGQFKMICDRAQAAQLYLERTGFPVSVQFVAAEIRFLAARGGGQVIGRLHLARGRPAKGRKMFPPETFLSLGISRPQSHRWKRIAQIPEEAFQRYLAECRETGRLPTRDELLQLEVSLRSGNASAETRTRNRSKVRPRAEAATKDVDVRNIAGDKSLGDSAGPVLSWDDAQKHRRRLRELLEELSGEKPLDKRDSALLRYTVRLCNELDQFVHQLPPGQEQAERESVRRDTPIRDKRRKKS
jgi:hypothetical protein